MHVRFSTCIGTNVMVESTDEVIGNIYDVLIHPDIGKIEGFFVQIPNFFAPQGLYLSSSAILRWGTSIMVRDTSDVSDASDHIRLESLLNDPRRFLSQPIRTETGKYIGRCKDIQFDTQSMHIEWIFPKRFWKWGTALPITEVIEVDKKNIIVKDPTVYIKNKVSAPSDVEVFDALPGVTRKADK